MSKVISIWNYRIWREIWGGGGGGGKFSKAQRNNYDARFTDVACINPVQKKIKYNVINENKIKICWNQLDFISANFELTSHLDYLLELRWRDLNLTLCYFYLRFGKTGNKKPATSFATLLYNELNSDVAWFMTHEKILPPYRSLADPDPQIRGGGGWVRSARPWDKRGAPSGLIFV